MRLSALGDVLHALPVLTALRAHLPEARIDWAVEDRAADLLRSRPEIDEVLVLPRRDLARALAGMPRPVRLWRTAAGFLGPMRERAYDVALDLQGNFKSGVVSRLSGAALRFGPSRAAAREMNHLFSHRRAAVPLAARHRVERNLALASALLGVRLPYVHPGFPTTPADRKAAADLVARAGLPARGYTLLQPGTSAFGAFKRWPPERFGALARRLRSEGRTVAVAHGPDEADLAAAVAAEAGGDVPLLVPSSLLVLAEVIRGAADFVAADTGPLHLAALVGTPLLGLFGPKDPSIYGPYGLRADGAPGLLPVLTQDDVACRPCVLRRCPNPLCMRTMSPERVHAALTTERPVTRAGPAPAPG